MLFEAWRARPSAFCRSASRPSWWIPVTAPAASFAAPVRRWPRAEASSPTVSSLRLSMVQVLNDGEPVYTRQSGGAISVEWVQRAFHVNRTLANGLTHFRLDAY